MKYEQSVENNIQFNEAIITVYFEKKKQLNQKREFLAGIHKLVKLYINITYFEMYAFLK